jgi:hypothetical protein
MTSPLNSTAWRLTKGVMTVRDRANLLDLIDCARGVVARWDKGDLAEAVRNLEMALDQIDADDSPNFTR